MTATVQASELSTDALSYTMNNGMDNEDGAAITHTTIQDCGMMIDDAATMMSLNDISMDVAVNIEDHTIHSDMDDLNNMV